MLTQKDLTQSQLEKEADFIISYKGYEWCLCNSIDSIYHYLQGAASFRKYNDEVLQEIAKLVVEKTEIYILETHKKEVVYQEYLAKQHGL